MIARDREKIFQIQVRELMVGLTAKKAKLKFQLKLRRIGYKKQSKCFHLIGALKLLMMLIQELEIFILLWLRVIP